MRGKQVTLLFLFGCLVTVLVGCQTAAERSAANEASDDYQCANMGRKTGPTKYFQCRQFLAQQRLMQQQINLQQGQFLKDY